MLDGLCPSGPYNRGRERERENNVVQDCDLLSVNWSLEKKSDHVGLVKFELVLKGLDKKRLRHD